MKIREFAMMLSLSAVLGLIACGSDDANPASDGGVSGSAMVDSRDGQSYRIVKIGKQTWMAQNLNYAAPNSVCYDNNPDFCAVYGRLISMTQCREHALLAGTHRVLKNGENCCNLLAIL